MRDEIIDLLRASQGEPISGEDISQRFSVSRTAIWKHIQALRQDGYDIESVYKKGYILRGAPDLLLPGEISARLETKWLGRHIIYEKSLSSTNDLAKRAALDGCPHGTVVLSEEQVTGRGRIARGWFSPFAAGIWCSMVLRPPLMPHEAPKFTLLMAVALTETFLKYPGIKVAIKWPNDILCQGKKLVGILTEMNAEMQAINYLVVGTGINVNIKKDCFPEDIKDKAASLADFTGKKIDRVVLLATMLKKVEELYDDALKNGFAGLLDKWRGFSATLGKEVRVIAPDETFTGRALDIDASGALVVERANGARETVLAGDVSIRAANGDSYV